MQRTTDWRIRLDTTTSWSIISVMALVCWLIKLDGVHQRLERPAFETFLGLRLQVGDLPIWVSMLAVAALYAYLAGIVLVVNTGQVAEADVWQVTLKELGDLDK
jgi:uncharacterized membrane protein